MCWHLPKVDGTSIFGQIGEVGLWGVDLFFVLSGYLIANQLFKTLTSVGHIPLYNFYIRRALRTWPNYFFVLLLYFLFPVIWEHPTMPSLWKFLTFTQNFELTFSAFSHAWSLCIEEQFYFILPIIVVALWKQKSIRFNVSIVIVLVILGMITRGTLWFLYAHESLVSVEQYFSKIYYPTWGRLDGLIFGVSIAAIKNFLPSLWNRLEQKNNWLLLLGFVILLIGFTLQSNRFALIPTVLGFPTISFGFALIVLASISDRAILNSYRIPGVRIIATLSFSIYLVHKQVFHLIHKSLAGINVYWISSAAIVASFIAAAILYFLIEKPFLILRDRSLPRCQNR